MFVDFFIRRPIFATVCALLIVLAGAVCIPTLPISLYPTLAPPQVVVTSNYIGANSKDVESAVTTILEQSINGVEGMRYMSSTSSNDGTSAITITFQTGYDLNIAAVDVQNRVASAQGRLPAVVNNTGITITKANSELRPCRRLHLAGQVALAGLHLQLHRRLRQGRAQARPRRRRRHHLRRAQVRHAPLARSQPPRRPRPHRARRHQRACRAERRGRRRPARPAALRPQTDFQMAVRVVGRLTDPRQFENIVIKNSPNGGGSSWSKTWAAPRSAPRTTTPSLKFSGTGFPGGEAVGVGVQQLSNANALDVDKRCRAVLAELEKSYPPGLKGIIAVDTTLVIGESVHEVVTTIGEAIIIVIIVIFLFLQDWRATIIPAVTIPVSLIGTFAFIKIFGFSINSLTLFGITLATGLVVDDAIVVIENVQRHLSGHCDRPRALRADRTGPLRPRRPIDHAKATGTGRGMETVSSDPHEATSIAMAEVTSAVIATSLVLISVFIPVSFFPGTTGILYKQFSLTIAFSIAISAFNALTLSPALAAILLRAETRRHGIMGSCSTPSNASSSGSSASTRAPSPSSFAFATSCC